MNINDLPDFLQAKINDMDENVKKAFLSTITPEWVEIQKICHELFVEGVEKGKWTIDDIKELMKNSKPL